jgi:hypothetical protein
MEAGALFRFAGDLCCADLPTPPFFRQAASKFAQSNDKLWVECASWAGSTQSHSQHLKANLLW